LSAASIVFVTGPTGSGKTTTLYAALHEINKPDLNVSTILDDSPAEVPFYRGRGRPKCRGTGYKGRIAFHELVLIIEEIRSMISEGRSAQEITRTAAKVGYRPLRYDGLKKVLLGLTTIEEIDQNTSFEWAQ